MAIETGIFDFGNIGFMSQLPHLAPSSLKAKGKELWLQVASFQINYFCNQWCHKHTEELEIVGN